jgi:hypothetical protein
MNLGVFFPSFEAQYGGGKDPATPPSPEANITLVVDISWLVRITPFEI